MKLPIDVIPGGGQLRFRWRHRTDTIVGQKVVECDGSLPPSVEQAVAELIATAKRLEQECDAANRRANAAEVLCSNQRQMLDELRGHAQRADGAEAGDGVDMGTEPKPPKGSSSRGRRGS